MKNTMMKENPQTVTNKKDHKERLRRCIGCRTSNTKESMIRFVKDENGKAIFDQSMNMDGRGTYVCRNAECLNNAIKRNAFSRAIHCNGLSFTPEAVLKETGLL